MLMSSEWYFLTSISTTLPVIGTEVPVEKVMYYGITKRLQEVFSCISSVSWDSSLEGPCTCSLSGEMLISGATLHVTFKTGYQSMGKPAIRPISPLNFQRSITSVHF